MTVSSALSIAYMSVHLLTSKYFLLIHFNNIVRKKKQHLAESRAPNCFIGQIVGIRRQDIEIAARTRRPDGSLLECCGLFLLWFRN
jgi:hypothetical protein